MRRAAAARPAGRPRGGRRCADGRPLAERHVFDVFDVGGQRHEQMVSDTESVMGDTVGARPANQGRSRRTGRCAVPGKGFRTELEKYTRLGQKSEGVDYETNPPLHLMTLPVIATACRSGGRGHLPLTRPQVRPGIFVVLVQNLAGSFALATAQKATRPRPGCHRRMMWRTRLLHRRQRQKQRQRVVREGLEAEVSIERRSALVLGVNGQSNGRNL